MNLMLSKAQLFVPVKPVYGLAGKKQGITLAMKTNIEYINSSKQTGREIDKH